MTRIIVDAGPLVAYFNRQDRWHRRVADQMAVLHPPLLTCEPVITERFSDCRLFTLDSDFEHYRRNGRRVISLLHPA